MMALSIRQPWAWLIVNRFKDVENRTWKTRIRGRVLVHAGLTMKRGDYCIAKLILAQTNPEIQMPEPKEFRRGGIVGEVDILDCVPAHGSPWFCGPYGFVLANARARLLVPCRGQLGFFRPEI